MSSFDHNLDGYRVLADLLSELREAVFSSLKEVHGDTWYQNEVFRPIIERLITRKEEEASIDWYNDEYQELIRFTDFTDLLAFLESDTNVLPRVRSLAPSPALLHTRFLELETLRNKLALAREITESELAYLTAFHRRYKNLADRPESGRSQAPVVDPQSKAAAASEPPKATEPSPTPRAEPDSSAAAADPSPTGRDTPSSSDSPADSGGSTTPKLKDALAERDDKAVLRHLYSEVTKLSDELFTPGDEVYPVVWPVVRRSEWYETRFTELGLQSLSSFYELLEQAMEHKAEYGDEADMHTFLKDRDFARVLLGLRDMFQKIGV